jgi:hypothetical protein
VVEHLYSGLMPEPPPISATCSNSFASVAVRHSGGRVSEGAYLFKGSWRSGP